METLRIGPYLSIGNSRKNQTLR